MRKLKKSFTLSLMSMVLVASLGFTTVSAKTIDTQIDNNVTLTKEQKDEIVKSFNQQTIYYAIESSGLGSIALYF